MRFVRCRVHVAYATGFAHAKQLQKGTFVVSLDALQKLAGRRSFGGDSAMETLCFSLADMLYSDPAYREVVVTKTFLESLCSIEPPIEPQFEWTRAEQKLETDLASWK